MKQAPVLTERDMKRVLQHVARGGFPARNRCLLMLSWLAGMRVAEIAALRISDVVTATGEVRPEIQLSPAQTKGNAARTVLVGSQLKSELEAYLRSLPESPAPDWPLIPSKTGRKFSANGLCQVMLHIYDRAGLDRATSHSGRRTFITTLAHKGVNVRVLAALAGHRHIGTTQRYIDLNDNVLRAAVEMI
jgi:integrase/recombinase XerD